jgi:hypothetical protein
MHEICRFFMDPHDLFLYLDFRDLLKLKCVCTELRVTIGRIRRNIYSITTVDYVLYTFYRTSNIILDIIYDKRDRHLEDWQYGRFRWYLDCHVCTYKLIERAIEIHGKGIVNTACVTGSPTWMAVMSGMYDIATLLIQNGGNMRSEHVLGLVNPTEYAKITALFN